jgi:predicted transcriptional regulator
VFKVFTDNPDRAFTIQEIIESVEVTENTVRTSIRRLKKRGSITRFRDPYSGIGREGKNKVYFALSTPNT